VLASIPVCSLLADNRAMLLRIAAVDTEEKWDSFLALAAPAACASKVRFVLLFFFHSAQVTAARVKRAELGAALREIRK